MTTCKERSQMDRRDLSLLSLMLDTGLRLSEVAQLTPADIGEDNTLRVFGKGRKWRTVALGSTSATALSRWMRLLPDSAATLWSGTRGPMTATGIRRVIARRGREAGLKLHPHQLRHTSSTHGFAMVVPKWTWHASAAGHLRGWLSAMHAIETTRGQSPHTGQLHHWTLSSHTPC